MKWKRKPPEVADGQADYHFNGRVIMTRGVTTAIPEQELIAIVQDIKKIVKEFGGIDYLQIYEHEESGVIIWVMDQVTKAALSRGDHPPEHNYFTILFPSEY